MAEGIARATQAVGRQTFRVPEKGKSADPVSQRFASRKARTVFVGAQSGFISFHSCALSEKENPSWPRSKVMLTKAIVEALFPVQYWPNHWAKTALGMCIMRRNLRGNLTALHCAHRTEEQPFRARTDLVVFTEYERRPPCWFNAGLDRLLQRFDRCLVKRLAVLAEIAVIQRCTYIASKEIDDDSANYPMPFSENH